MAIIPSYFSDFVSNIRLTDTQIDECKSGHTTLRERIHADEDLSPIIVDSFLQGSYRRATAIRPSSDTKKSDVDIIVVTTMDRSTVTPVEALNRFVPFLDKHYKGKYEPQGRSWGIKLSYVELDLVPTSAPSEAVKTLVKSASVLTNESIEEAKDWQLGLDWGLKGNRLLKSTLITEAEKKQWQTEPLWIPDRDAKIWDETHPLAQIEATQRKNKACNSHYVNVVKCLKWWRTTQQPKPKYPKSYPLEHLLGLNCPDGIDSVAMGVVRALESIRDQYQGYAILKQTPFVPDHGVPSHNVLGRVEGSDFAAFHELVTAAAKQARTAFDEQDTRKSARLWRDLFGEKFPEPPFDQSNEGDGGNEPKPGGYTPRTGVSIIGGGRFA
ncbi:MAG: nucleotidyltransferase [Ignavibacteriae bacterium]|nr:nucleotidyltransferase [Ignavibacteriota bacterium]